MHRANATARHFRLTTGAEPLGVWSRPSSVEGGVRLCGAFINISGRHLRTCESTPNPLVANTTFRSSLSRLLTRTMKNAGGPGR